MAPSVAPKRTNESTASNGGDSNNNVKKRRLEAASSGQTRGDRIAKLTQQKSSFEGDLEKLTQGLTELKGGLYYPPSYFFIYGLVKLTLTWVIQSMSKRTRTGIDLRLSIFNLVRTS